MMNPLAQAQASLLQRPAPGMAAPGMGGATGMGGPAPQLPGMPMPGQQQNPLAALGLGGPQNQNEQPWLMNGSHGFMDPVPSNNTGNPGMLMDPILMDQIQGGFPPKSETFQQLSPMLFRPDGPFSQQQGPGMSLGAQLQAAPPPASQGTQGPRPGGMMAPASSPLLQALGGR
jgi:hypothetical protein